VVRVFTTSYNVRKKEEKWGGQKQNVDEFNRPHLLPYETETAVQY
jgi:hypothetical protein